MRLDELPHLTYQLAMVNRCRSVWHVPAENRTKGRHDFRVAMQLHGLQTGQHRSQVSLADLDDLQLALALGQAFGQRGELVPIPLQLGRVGGKLLPLLVESMVAT